jgi:hypothetical protein
MGAISNGTGSDFMALCARSAASRNASRFACQERIARKSSVSAVAVKAPG